MAKVFDQLNYGSIMYILKKKMKKKGLVSRSIPASPFVLRPGY